MERVAFSLRLRPGAGESYDRAHQRVWPEMLDLLKSAGICEYSIFRRGEVVLLTMRCENFERAWEAVERSPVNARWQAGMAEFFEPLGPLREGERFPMLREIFYMP